MAGGEIFCGSFHGKEKSLSAYPVVLDALEARARGQAKATIRRLKKAVNPLRSDTVEITKAQASVLLPLLSDYKKELVKLIGHSDWSKAADLGGRNWEKGNGVQLYAVTDLIPACRVSIAKDEPIIIFFS
ncbi:MAG TPA: hypothetical protein VL361_02420 [Candidatus Limnocylindrales bacterium]|jgi:hypothetical protein|nr:hypothetical protein [Candidatus Limnocylindrales bacterium]